MMPFTKFTGLFLIMSLTTSSRPKNKCMRDANHAVLVWSSLRAWTDPRVEALKQLCPVELSAMVMFCICSIQYSNHQPLVTMKHLTGGQWMEELKFNSYFNFKCKWLYVASGHRAGQCSSTEMSVW